MDYNAPYGSSDPNAPYIDRNTATATKGSAIPAAFPNQVQNELVNLISAAGLTPDTADLEQVAKAIQSGQLNYASAAGTAGALTVTLPVTPDALLEGMEVGFKAAFDCAGATTVNINGIGGLALTDANGNALGNGAYKADNMLRIAFDGTGFRIVGGAFSTRLVDIQVFKVSATYNTPDGAKAHRIRIQAAGGGGGGSGGTPIAGGNGGDTLFGSTAVGGGSGGLAASSGTIAGGGGGGPAASVTKGFSVPGGGGDPGFILSASAVIGGNGGNSVLGGGGNGNHVEGSGGASGNPGSSNTGAGGGGGANIGSPGGGGGGAGGHADYWIFSPEASYPVVIGAGGSAGTGAVTGGAGADGIAILEAYF